MGVNPAHSKEPHLVRAARVVIAQRQYRFVHEKTGRLTAPSNKHKIMLDGVTSNMIVTVFDALNAENKAKFQNCTERFGVVGFVTRLWKLVQ